MRYKLGIYQIKSKLSDIHLLLLVWGRNIFGGSSGIEELEHASQSYFVESGVSMRKWRPPTATADDDWKVV